MACRRKAPRAKAALLAQAGLISGRRCRILSTAGCCCLEHSCCYLEYSLSHQPWINFPDSPKHTHLVWMHSQHQLPPLGLE